MRAVTFSEFGGTDRLEVLDLPAPQAGPGEVLVAVEAATLNPADAGSFSGAFGARMPAAVDGHWTPGWDLAGHVTAVGDGVDASLVGAYVLGFSQWFQTGNGTQAGVVALANANVAVADEKVPPAELTTVGLNALTAYQALDLAGVAEGTVLLVTGAAGGVGGFAVELAAKRGAEVYGYASESDRDTVLGFGAKHFIARETGSLEGLGIDGDGVDAAFDPAGIGEAAIGAVRDRGTFVTAGREYEYPRAIAGTRVGVRTDRDQLQFIADAASAGDLTLRVAATYPVDEARAAYEKLAEPGLRGRVVLTF